MLDFRKEKNLCSLLTFLLLSPESVLLKCVGEPFCITGPPLIDFFIVVVVFAVLVTYFFGEAGGDLLVVAIVV